MTNKKTKIENLDKFINDYALYLIQKDKRVTLRDFAKGLSITYQRANQLYRENKEKIDEKYQQLKG